jgi:hypothetical protein
MDFKYAYILVCMKYYTETIINMAAIRNVEAISYTLNLQRPFILSPSKNKIK